MKRWKIFLLILICFSTLGFAQRRGRLVVQRIIQLVEPDQSGKVFFEQTIVRQRNGSGRTSKMFESTHMGQLAWAGLGLTEQQRDAMIDPAAVAGPFQLYFATQEGLFTYQRADHSVSQIEQQDVRIGLSQATASPELVANAGCSIIVVGTVGNITASSRNRAESIMFLEGGRIAQNIQLQAISLDLAYISFNDFDTSAVGRICGLSRGEQVLCMISVGLPSSQIDSNAVSQNPTQTSEKRAAFIVPSQNFQDNEFFEIITALTTSGIQSVIASSRTGIINGVSGRQIQVSVLAHQLNIDDFDAFIFIGGPGVSEFFNAQPILDLVRAVRSRGKIIAAISSAPVILANAGILNEVRATTSTTTSDALLDVGAIYNGLAVVRDNNIITASGSQYTIPFSQNIIDALSGR